MRNASEQTVASMLASNSIIPSKEWEHDKFIKIRYNGTVAKILSYKGIVAP